MNTKINIKLSLYIEFLIFEYFKISLPLALFDSDFYRLNKILIDYEWTMIMNKSRGDSYINFIVDLQKVMYSIRKFQDMYLKYQSALDFLIFNPSTYDSSIYPDLIYILKFIKQLEKYNKCDYTIYSEDIQILYLKYKDPIFIKYQKYYNTEYKN